MNQNAVIVADPAFASFADKAEVRGELDKMRVQLEEVLPAQIDPARFLRVAASSIMKTPSLMSATKVSIFASLMEAAQLGLEPSGLLGSAYLVPYRRKTDSGWITEAKLIPGYRGLIDLARRSGGIRAIWANVVRQKDRFRLVQGDNPGIEHEPFIPDPTMEAIERDPGFMVGAYMVAILESGEKQIEWMSADEIAAVRKRSKAATDGPWVTDESEMSRKTVVRRGSKYLPLSPEFRRALELDEEAEAEASLPPSRPVTEAEKILAQRRGETVQDGPGPAEDSEAESASIPAEERAPEGVSVTQDGSCAAVPPESPLGLTQPCTKPADHRGPHVSPEGSWPR